jgi:hypothetical protein
MTQDELREHINTEILKFVGREDVDQVKEEMRVVLTKIITENIDQIDFIQQVIEEGSKNDITKTMDGNS